MSRYKSTPTRTSMYNYYTYSKPIDTTKLIEPDDVIMDNSNNYYHTIKVPNMSDINQYEVEAILDCKWLYNRDTKRKEYMYLVQWKDYSDATWEGKESLLPGAKKMLANFKRNSNNNK